MSIQAILFPIKRFTSTQARRYLKKHNHKQIKHVHKTKNFLRYRLIEPHKNDKYISKKMPSGVIYVIKMAR